MENDYASPVLADLVRVTLIRSAKVGEWLPSVAIFDVLRGDLDAMREAMYQQRISGDLNQLRLADTCDVVLVVPRPDGLLDDVKVRVRRGTADELVQVLAKYGHQTRWTT